MEGSAKRQKACREETMLPSTRDVEEVILAVLKSGNWARGVTLLLGAIRLPCVPTARTYAKVVSAVATCSRWDVAVRVLDGLHTSPLSARALYHTLADAILETENLADQGGALLAVVLAARRRRLSLAVRHYMQCSTLLLDSGDWHGALLAGSQDRLVQHVPALAHTMMLAAAAGRQWLVGTKIMSSILVSGGLPSAVVTENFLRCFSPTSPWWRALAVASVLSCSGELGVVQRARELREEVTKTVGSSETDSGERGRQAVSRCVDSHMTLCDLTLAEATRVFLGLQEHHWERALDILGSFPTLLEIKPRPRVLKSPMSFLFAAGRRFRFWEVVWQNISRSLFFASIEDVFRTAGYFYAYFYAEEYCSDVGKSNNEEEVVRVRERIGAFINARRLQSCGAFEPMALQPFLRDMCQRGFWEDALFVSGKPFLVFTELTESHQWEASIAVYGAMQPSAKERAAPKLEHLFISNELWMHALIYAQGCLPENTLPMRNLVIPLCAALGQWHRAVSMLLHHVPSPTVAERSLLQHCVVQWAEVAICRAFEKDDWIRALKAWTAICRVQCSQMFFSTDKKKINLRKATKYTCLNISSRTVECIAQLLLNHQRYDESCLVVSLHRPVTSDSILLHCLHLFHRIRLSPLLYGKVLQQYRETYAPYRSLLDCYAVLALGVSGNLLGAFGVLRELALWKHAGKTSAVVQGLKQVFQVKIMLSSIFIYAAQVSQVEDVETVLDFFTCCVVSLDDVDLLTDSLVALWGTKKEELRECVFRTVMKLIRNMLTLDLPVSYAVMRIVAEGLENQLFFSVADLFFEALLQRRLFYADNDVKDKEGKRDVLLQPSKKEEDYFFWHSARVFISGGHWGRALEALQHCEVIDVATVFQTAIFFKEEEDRRARVVQRVIVEVGSEDKSKGTMDKSLSFAPGPGAVCDALLALTHVHAWKTAIALFNGVTDADHCKLGPMVHSWSVAIGAVLSCVSNFAPWNVSLQFLMTVTQRGFLFKDAPNDKALTNMLHSVRRHGGSVMCSKLLLFMVEQMGIVPTPSQYEVLLRSCLGSSQLTLVEQDVCGENLRRLSQSLNERQVISLIIAISAFSGFSEDEKIDGELLCPSTGLGKQREGKLFCSSSLTEWIPTKRPSLNTDEFFQLCQFAPEIVLATSRVLERLSKECFSGRFRPFELKLLLQHYRYDVLAWIRSAEADRFAAEGVNTRVVEVFKNNRLLHLLLVPFYECLWWRAYSTPFSFSVYEKDDATIFFGRLASEVFHDFVSLQTMRAICESCRPCVAKLAAQRWPWLCEYELLRAVRRNVGRPPLSLCTRPGASRADIAFYWATYGRVLWPEVFFSGPELCQLAVYVPLVEPLLNNEKNLLELITGIQLAHFSAETIPYSERFLRQPRSVSAIRVVFRLAFKTLKRLYTQLDMDARAGRYYYYHQPNESLWKRYSMPVPTGDHSSRWTLALRIIRHYHRSTKTNLPPRMLAAFFAVCAADRSENTSFVEKLRGSSNICSWWQLAIRCAQSVDPNLSHESWRHAMFLAFPKTPKKCCSAKVFDEYRLDDMCNVSLQASTRVLLEYANRGEKKIPFAVSLLLVEQIKEVLGEVHSACEAQNTYTQGEDLLICWALLQTNRCLKRIEPVHAELLERLLFGKGGGEDRTDIE